MKKVIFLKQGNFSHINGQVHAQLVRHFTPEAVQVVDVWSDIVRQSPRFLARATLEAARRHGPKALWGTLRLRRYIERTPFYFSELQREISARFVPKTNEIAFTFQTQSMFDGSIPQVPHFVYTDHTHLANLQYPGFDRSTLLPAEWREKERQVYRHASLNFTMSQHVGRSMIEDYGVAAERVACVFAGSNAGTRALPLNNNHYSNQNILFVGIDWERKGGPLLVRAFAKVQQKYPNARLTIVGPSPSISLPNCDVLGRLPLAEVAQCYTRASVFCFPTRAEPFGIAPLEAFMQKIPVIASNLGAMPDFIRDGVSGRLIPPDDIDALTHALAELISNPERCRQFGEAGHALVKSRYNWDSVGNTMAAAIRDVCGRSIQTRPNSIIKSDVAKHI